MVLQLFLLLVVAVVAVVAFGAGYCVAQRRLRSGAPEIAPPLLGPAASGEPPTRVTYTRDVLEGTSAWRVAMSDVGGRMGRARVRHVLFAHGSFVGDDPLALARVVDEAVPALPGIARALRRFTRTSSSRLLGDLSNFPEDYVSTFGEATGVPTSDFVWSSENHHLARVQGAVRLARTLALRLGDTLQPGDRVLLVGHSHAGQLFALLSQLLGRVHGYDELIEAARLRGEDVGALEDHLALLRHCRVSFDVVTMGTAPRYGWARGTRFRILHVVNHRGAAPRARSLLGLLHTRSGDYVHQIGGHGSDFPAPTAREREANLRLDSLLGKGGGAVTWLKHVARGLRVSPEGRTVLVDYEDHAGFFPNFLATGFGHAAYTRRDAMLFHARLIALELYPDPPDGALPQLPPGPLSPLAPLDWASRARGWIAPRRSARRLVS